MSRFEYKVVEDPYGMFSLREIHYDDEGTPYSHSRIIFEEFDSVEELRDELYRATKAAKQEVLDETEMNAARVEDTSEFQAEY